MTEKQNTIQTFRDDLMSHFRDVLDKSKPLDIQRHRAICEISKQIIETAKVEVAFAAVVKGALDLPFLEGQEKTDPTPKITGRDGGMDEATPVTPMDRMARTLASGPGPDHPWNRDRERDRQKRA